MDIQKLTGWREEFKKVDGTPQMKVVACNFRDAFHLHHMIGAQIFDLLRSKEIGTALNLLQAAEQVAEGDERGREQN